MAAFGAISTDGLSKACKRATLNFNIALEAILSLPGTLS